VAREDGALLLIPGQPVLDQAAETILETGDAGWAHVPWPTSVVPALERLEASARQQIAVDGGRVELDGEPDAAYLPIVRVGVVVEYSISTGDRFQETEEVFVEGRTGVLLADAVVEALSGCTVTPGPGPGHPSVAPDVVRSLARAHGILEQRAAVRQTQLAQETSAVREAELGRVAAYYDSALASIVRQRAAAAVDRGRWYEARADAIRAERTRGLRGAARTFPVAHDIRPFRLQVIGVPALTVPVVIRRGRHTFPLMLDWYLASRTYAPVACPHCGYRDILVAGGEWLGCRTCMPRPGQPSISMVPSTLRIAEPAFMSDRCSVGD
jgi:hypothetical protein